MISRLLLTLVRLVMLSAALSLPAQARLKDYPFRIAAQDFDGQSALEARNEGPATITARMDFAGDNTSSDFRWPVTVVLPPHTTYALGRVVTSDRSKPGQRSISSSFQFGDARAVPGNARYRLPYEAGSAFTIGQAFGGRLRTHNTPESQYAVDFSLPENTPIVAARDGVVVEATFSFRRGGLDPDLKDKANVVFILHDDGTVAHYAHLAAREMPIKRGDRVSAGTMIGYSGDTGFSEGPHLHFAVTKPQVQPNGIVAHVAIPIVFYAGDPAVEFEPKEGMRVTAKYPRTSPAAAVSTVAATGAAEAPAAAPAPMAEARTAAAPQAGIEPAGAVSAMPAEHVAAAPSLPAPQFPAPASPVSAEPVMALRPPLPVTPLALSPEPVIAWSIWPIVGGVGFLALVFGALTVLAPKRVEPQPSQHRPDWPGEDRRH